MTRQQRVLDRGQIKLIYKNKNLNAILNKILNI